jgi:cytidyltransferase-like protein
MKKIAFIAGCFDGPNGPHAGHLHILAEMRKLAPYTVVAINHDAYLARKGRGRPLMKEEQRRAALYATGLVDEVITIGDSPLEVIEFLRPNFIVVGDDYTIDKVVGAKECKKWKGKVVIVPRIPGHSTSEYIVGMDPGTAEGDKYAEYVVEAKK